MNDELADLLTEVVNADHFDDRLYQRVFGALGAQNRTNKLLTAIANSLEEYYNYHNSRSLLRGSRLPIPPEAEDEREELKLYTEALRQGITEFRSLKQLKSKLNQSCNN